tara:strand:- start:2764 stop:3924 length:1161 start_codon:yes stop_codon:yes gene_type:complete
MANEQMAPKPKEKIKTASQKQIDNTAKNLQEKKDDLLYKIAEKKRKISGIKSPTGGSTAAFPSVTKDELSSEEKIANKSTIAFIESEIRDLEKKIKGIDVSLTNPGKDWEYKQAGKNRYGKYKISEDAPYLTEDVKQQFIGAGVDIGNDASWYNGGLGNASAVYMGPGQPIETRTKGTKGIGYRKRIEETDDVKYIANIQREFWTNDSIKDKIMGAYASVGENLTQWDASQMWDTYVARAAVVYQGGKGKKLTPYDLMNDDLANMRKNAAPKDTLTKTKLDYAEIRELLVEVGRATSGFVPGEKVLKKAFEDYEKKNRGVYSQNSLIESGGGKVIDQSIVDKGLTEAEIKRNFEKQMEKKNPLETERQGLLNFNTAVMNKMNIGAI